MLCVFSFLCFQVFLSKSVQVNNYDRYRIFVNKFHLCYKVSSQNSKYFLGYAKKTSNGSVQPPTLFRKKNRRFNEIMALLIALSWLFLANTHRKNFYWSLFLLKPQILNCRPVKFGKKGQTFYKSTNILTFWALPKKYL